MLSVADSSGHCAAMTIRQDKDTIYVRRYFVACQDSLKSSIYNLTKDVRLEENSPSSMRIEIPESSKEFYFVPFSPLQDTVVMRENAPGWCVECGCMFSNGTYDCVFNFGSMFYCSGCTWCTTYFFRCEGGFTPRNGGGVILSASKLILE